MIREKGYLKIDDYLFWWKNKIFKGLNAEGRYFLHVL